MGGRGCRGCLAVDAGVVELVQHPGLAAKARAGEGVQALLHDWDRHDHQVREVDLAKGCSGRSVACAASAKPAPNQRRQRMATSHDGRKGGSRGLF